ncbi:MAG: HAD-IIA family hydrolase [Actinomycetota bacterium]|nr:HAD-IIA family hydrolase [Actinomycetota bacterium]
MGTIEGLLLDVDGVLTEVWRPLPGAGAALAALRERGLPFLLATNTTTHTRGDLATLLAEAGLEVAPRELVTATVAAGEHLRARHPGARVFLLGGRAAAEDLGRVELVEDGAGVVLVAGADPTFTWENMTRAFRMLRAGAALVAMHRNPSWTPAAGLMMDSGPFIAALERVTGVEATVTGKPPPEFFRLCVERLSVPRERVAMVGDNLVFDVLAAQACGLRGVLVRTGVFDQRTLAGASVRPDHVIDSIADLAELLDAG